MSRRSRRRKMPKRTILLAWIGSLIFASPLALTLVFVLMLALSAMFATIWPPSRPARYYGKALIAALAIDSGIALMLLLGITTR